LMSQQHEVVHVVLNKLLSMETYCKNGCFIIFFCTGKRGIISKDTLLRFTMEAWTKSVCPCLPKYA
ncbi:MAG: hypothetical protein AAB332_04670, partial [Planctomycetota bacterium]